jgi:hypothetical protein
VQDSGRRDFPRLRILPLSRMRFAASSDRAVPERSHDASRMAAQIAKS